MLIFKKEKRVVGLIIEHIEKTAECVYATTDNIRIYLNNDHSDNADAASRVNAARVNSLEAEADSLLREIRELLYSGAYLPQMRSDIYRLMSSVDLVTNRAEDCSDFVYLQSPAIPEEFRSDIASIIELTDESFRQFYKALKHYFGPKDKSDKVRMRGKKIGELESQIDKLERSVTIRIFDSQLDKSDKIHLQQCLAQITRISDTIEDAADELELINVKSIV
jgi:predicted phosphate transport protein (TIGR00153 family)